MLRDLEPELGGVATEQNPRLGLIARAEARLAGQGVKQ
jgi:hypothetical protein